MSLILHLQSVDNLHSRGDRMAKVTFRGIVHYSKVSENAEDSVVFDETFTWSIARPIEPDEQVEIQIYTYNKYLSNRLVGTFGMVLQQIVEVGQLKVTDCLIDDNNVVMQACVTFELSYKPPDGSTGNWQREGYGDPGELEGRDEERRLLIPPDRLSGRDVDHPNMRRGSKLSVASRGSQALLKSPTNAIKSIRSISKIMKFGKHRPDQLLSSSSDAHLSKDPITARDNGENVGTMESQLFTGDVKDADVIIDVAGVTKRLKLQEKVEHLRVAKAQDYQVSVTVIEARQLAGLNMDPVVCVQVGDQKKYTSVKESTNCPYYNEYFVFDFNMPPAMLFDKIITLTVLQSQFLRSYKMIGHFRLDVGTVYSHSDHQFYHKWAMLTDPDDINSGPKGFLKCDLSVVGKGDNIKVPQKTDKDEDDIEANLLLPDGVPSDRQKANIYVCVYKAEGLPKMATGLMANVKKALTGEAKDLVDPYVLVSFAGHKGKTSVRRGNYEPVWNEQVVFTEMFPPLCRRIKIQLVDDSVNGDVIGTHFIDLTKISNEGEKGFLPTFGPAWINFYGSTRSYSLLEEHSHLNDGLSEGVSYRGRLLVSLKTEILDSQDPGPSMVMVESTLPVSDGSVGHPEDFFVFGCVMEANMIDRKLCDRPLQIELSIGNYGNAIDGRNDPVKTRGGGGGGGEEEGDEDQEALISEESEDHGSSANEWHSTTDPILPCTTDRFYYFLPFDDNKPCLWVKGSFEDHRRRLFNTNILEKIAEKLEDGLQDVYEMVKMEKSNPEKRLRVVLDDLVNACSRYQSLTQAKVNSSAGRTRLDKERLKLCRTEIDLVGSRARTLRAVLNKSNVKEKLKSVHLLLSRVREIAFEPQHSTPDLFVWLIQNKKRIAYHRIPSKDVVFSAVEEERGKDCGRVQTLFLKLPGKKGSGPDGWTMQAKLQMHLWLGVVKHKKEVLKGLPEGFEDSPAVRRSCRIVGSPPPTIKYIEKQYFQLRAHMYQARGLIGSDDSGLSDPFARVVFGDQTLCTQVIDETLSPTWDEMVIFNEVIVYGTLAHIKEFPPTIVVEIFDQDKAMLSSSSNANQGKAEFIGRALARPTVKASHEKYEKPNFPPRLEWFDVYRGPDRAGELLAAFELLQLSPPGDASAEDLPPCELPLLEDKDRGAVMPVPKGIRPTLSRHRIEVLFWGVRELKRIQLMPVDRPRIDIECAGHILSSSVIQNAKKNPNFAVQVKYFDVDLPENELYCPPITIRCVDCRNFGRFVLVGSHVINNIHKFIYTPVTKSGKEGLKKFAEKAEFFQQTTLQLPSSHPGGEPRNERQHSIVSTKPDDVAVVIDDERQPLITKLDPIITIETSKGKKMEPKPAVEPKKKRRKSAAGAAEDDDNDLESFDWWTKYHASVDTSMREMQEKAESEGSVGGGNTTQADDRKTADDQSIGSRSPGSPIGEIIPNGIPSAEDPDYDPKEAKRMEKEMLRMEGKREGEKRPQKRPSKAAGIAAKLSPKSQRKKEQGPCNIAQLKIYQGDLEAQPDFNHFKEWLHTFDLFRGKKTGDSEDDDSRVVGRFKGGLVIYRLPLPTDIEEGIIDIGGIMKIHRLPASAGESGAGTGGPGAQATTPNGEDANGCPVNGIFQSLPLNEPIHVLIRVYVVKAIDLHPADLNGKADPYIVIRLGQTTINDKEHYISKQLNPVFGKCFEIEASFPQDSLLRVQIYDWDLIGSDDVIGETHIDLENRYYSRHRATSGIAKKYEVEGYNAWRDPMKPTQILSKLCKENRVDGPFYQPGKVRVANRIFNVPLEVEDEAGVKSKANDEHLGLAVLHHWEEIPKIGCRLVPEHIETRSLYNPEKPGIEQGKLEMWVDMFPLDMPAPGPPVDISPRKPKNYELRVIIWNTDDVVLEDDAFFTGEKMSDIYVKGWIKGPEDMQCTDIHYRSLTGEGNFNWRFIFPFDYLVAEEKIVISRKDTMFSWDETETKIPARLNLQVWDADHFSSDDFLGSLTLDLNQFPRGAKSAKQCTLDMLKADGSVPQMSLFKHKRVKGWWPFNVKNEGEEMELTGKVEAELHLLTIEDSEKHPAGMGRNEPDPLDKPNRPDTSFIWFLNPLKSIRYILWHNYRWVILKAIIVMLLAVLIGLFFYSMPGYMVKKMMGA